MTFKTLALAAVAVASLAATAEAGQKKRGYFYKPHWTHSHQDHCWDYREVAQPYYAKVSYYHNGKKRWKTVKKVRYVTKAFNICDVHHY